MFSDVLFFDVNIGNGKTGKIGLRPGDDPYKKANDFARVFSLNTDMEEALAEMLNGYHHAGLEGTRNSILIMNQTNVWLKTFKY